MKASRLLSRSLSRSRTQSRSPGSTRRRTDPRKAAHRHRRRHTARHSLHRIGDFYRAVHQGQPAPGYHRQAEGRSADRRARLLHRATGGTALHRGWQVVRHRLLLGSAAHLLQCRHLRGSRASNRPATIPEQAWTWDQFLEVATALTMDVDGKHPNDRRLRSENHRALWRSTGRHWWISVHSAILGNGGDWIDPDTGLLVLDQPAATEAMQNIADLVNVHHVDPAGIGDGGAGHDQYADARNWQVGDGDRRLVGTCPGSTRSSPSWAPACCPAWQKRPVRTCKRTCTPPLPSSENPEESWQWVRFLSHAILPDAVLQIGLWLPSQSALDDRRGA